ncbi:MAG: dihydroxy-acid dehydratase [Deltaproteobacteria bacterium]|nr:dihydroxy-acid dehydratase [Deltaproteobacteria bacterium]
MAKKFKTRSPAWWGKTDRNGFLHRSWMKNQGRPDDLFDGRPVIGIANSWSELTPCNAHLRQVADAVKRGVWEAGGFPLEFPTMSLGEPLMRPTTMLFRNLMSMDVEESLRANPLDGSVLLCGCDKTTPAMLMGAASVNMPAIMLTGGPMLNGRFRGQQLGSGTDVWRLSEEVRAGTLTQADFMAAEAGNSRSVGHCNTMGTASTMASMAESLGMMLPGAAAIPAADARRYTYAHLTGRRIVEMVREELTVDKVLSRKAFENAIRTNAAIGGSTNAVVHLLAIAGRAGVTLELKDFDVWGQEMNCLANLQPSGKYLMEDFYYAGGLPAVMAEISKQLNLDALTVNGKTLGENLKEAACYNREVIYSQAKPFKPKSGIAVLRGNLAPDGAIIKPSAATPALMKHRGRAVVFENIEDFYARFDDPKLDVDEHCVLVLKNAGPRGYPGMAEVGNLPLPSKILKKGITDMVRISDARMSGTAYGTVVLHTAPEAAVGGPLALVKDGDMIELDVGARKLNLEVSDAELAKRKTAWKAPVHAKLNRGYSRLYLDHVLQADKGVDFDFLVGGSGDFIPRDNH